MSEHGISGFSPSAFGDAFSPLKNGAAATTLMPRPETTGDIFETARGSAAPNSKQSAHIDMSAWNAFDDPHADDNPFEEAPKTAPTRRENQGQADFRGGKNTPNAAAYKSELNRQIADNVHEAASSAAARGDIRTARFHENTATSMLANRDTLRSEHARMEAPGTPHLGTYEQFVAKNAQRDQLAFLHDNAMSKYSKTIGATSAARKNATWSARLMDSFGNAFSSIKQLFNGLRSK